MKHSTYIFDFDGTLVDSILFWSQKSFLKKQTSQLCGMITIIIQMSRVIILLTISIYWDYHTELNTGPGEFKKRLIEQVHLVFAAMKMWDSSLHFK